MLSDTQVDHYRTFGFVILRDFLGSAATAALSEEIDRAFVDAYGDFYSERPCTGGMDGHYLPAMSFSRTPVSLELVESDLLTGAAEQLLGARPLPSYAEQILYFGDAGVHDDFGIDVDVVKFAAYLEPLKADNGALRFLPGSHHPDFRERSRDWQSAHPAETREQLHEQIEALPMNVAESRPGDVIAFHGHVFHASIHGKDRRQWTVSYFADPTTERQRTGYREWVDDEVRWSGEHDDRPYDHDAYPVFDPEWIARARRPEVVARMTELGTFDALRGR